MFNLRHTKSSDQRTELMEVRKDNIKLHVNIRSCISGSCSNGDIEHISIGMEALDL
jgi:hypothetical protein